MNQLLLDSSLMASGEGNLAKVCESQDCSRYTLTLTYAPHEDQVSVSEGDSFVDETSIIATSVTVGTSKKS